MDQCQICNQGIAFRMCKKCNKVVCEAHFLKDLDVCIECGPMLMK